MKIKFDSLFKGAYRGSIKLTSIAAVAACSIFLSACGTSYKIAPSTEKIAVKVAVAKREIQHAQKQADELAVKTKETLSGSATTAGHIDAALTAITAHDYVTAAQELIAAKASNELVQIILKQSLRDVQGFRDSLKHTEQDLSDAEEEIKTLKEDIKKEVLKGAANQAIVDEVNWGFRIGAIFYFVKGLLKIGFFGILILIALVIGIVAFGGLPALLAVRHGVSGVFRLIRKPK